MRQPASFIPPLLFPTLLVAVNAAGLRPSTVLPGFPTDSFLAFAVAVPFIQGALFSTMNAGTDLARDIQTGFLNRLALTPMRNSTMLAGHIAGVIALGFIQSVFYLVRRARVRRRHRLGPAGVARHSLLGDADLRGVRDARGVHGTPHRVDRGDPGAVPGALRLPLLVVDERAAQPHGSRTGSATLATINPVSYLIEAVRSLVITGWDLEALCLGFGVAIAIIVLATTFASRAFRDRMVRT